MFRFRQVDDQSGQFVVDCDLGFYFGGTPL
jgi:hypothetical protein